MSFVRAHVRQGKIEAERELAWESGWVCPLFCLNASSSAASVHHAALLLVLCLYLDTLFALRWRDYISASLYMTDIPPLQHVLQRFVFQFCFDMKLLKNIISQVV